jgi:uncharacterized membrane-anchored protein YhcB (DUF1043 family)
MTWVIVLLAVVAAVAVGHVIRQAIREDRLDQAIRRELAERTETLIRWRP